MNDKFDIIIVGGGLAGLTSSVLLADAGRKVLLIEKKKYPFHKVCGEYVSNEVLPFLKRIGFDPFIHGASQISQFRISTPAGKNIYMPLDLGGFGLSRYVMDEQLSYLAVQKGVTVMMDKRVQDIQFSNNLFRVTTDDDVYESDLVIGSYGKRDTLDKKLKRDFMKERSGYLGVKYHIRIDYPKDEIGLDSFQNGYCGIVKIEKDLYNLCYLYKRTQEYKSVEKIEKDILIKNPVLKKIFSESEFVFKEPVVINQVSFRKKPLIEQNIIMCGDSAGLITPLCGNGMSMAIHAARLLADEIVKLTSAGKETSMHQRNQLYEAYSQSWKKMFSLRLRVGRNLQSLFGNTAVTSFALNTIHAIKPFERWVLKSTHGEVF
jgi:menaquinone-9 beta-reductase